MPYTPPSHRSPASSATASPDVSRRSSFQGTTGPRPSLPRSASYLTKHRRTPSAVEPHSNHVNPPTPQATSDNLKGMVNSSVVRQSPPPVADDSGMPKGAILSPPESNSGSDDDDLPEMRGRNIENLHELHEAISQIPQHRESSPDKGDGSKGAQTSDAGDLLLLPSQAQAISEGMRQSFSTTSLTQLAVGLRRASHSRSATESSIPSSKSAGNSLTGSEEDSEDEEMRRKPQMVRKKSGELVRPALRPPSRRRPSSMPGTPTFSKAVHFDSHLEHVRHFLQVDRPLAVSAGSSPADNYDSETEYPFMGDERQTPRTPPYEWEMIMSNFATETPPRRDQPVRLERVWLSNDQKSLVGSVVVANLAFQKHVTCRFTLDYWKTTSEITAEFVAEVRPKESPQGHDRFNFTIKLSDLANLESKTLYFCIRYNVNGQELWDNNGGTNFQVDFRKKMLPQNGKAGSIGAANRPLNSLPRSNRRNTPPSAPRPKSMPAGLDEFGDNVQVNFDQSIHDYLGESAPTSLRLKGVRSSASLPSDNLSSRLAPPSGQAFANRYDFGASLTAAVQAAKDAMSGKPDGLYMKPHSRPSALAVNTARLAVAPPSTDRGDGTAQANKVISALSGTDSPSIASASYEELVNKYCFFGSKQSSPRLKDGTLRSSRFDGADEILFTQSPTSTTNSSLEGSPIQNSEAQLAHAARVQGLKADPNPYFQHDAALAAIVGPSPSESPLKILSPQRISSPLASQPRSASASSQHSGRSSSPASMVGSFPPFRAASPSEFPYPHLSDRFPFSGPETHAAAAIRG